jgi:hypothetical protein
VKHSQSLHEVSGVMSGHDAHVFTKLRTEIFFMNFSSTHGSDQAGSIKPSGSQGSSNFVIWRPVGNKTSLTGLKEELHDRAKILADEYYHDANHQSKFGNIEVRQLRNQPRCRLGDMLHLFS